MRAPRRDAAGLGAACARLPSPACRAPDAGVALACAYRAVCRAPPSAELCPAATAGAFRDVRACAVRAACRSGLLRDAAQKVFAVRQDRRRIHRQVLRCATDTADRRIPRAASDASADRDGDRHGVDHQGLCRELVHDFRRTAWADAPEPQVALPQQALPQRGELSMAHRGLACPPPRPLDGALEELPPNAWRVLQVESGSGELEKKQSELAERAALRAWLREPRALALPEPLAWVAQPQVPPPDAS